MRGGGGGSAPPPWAPPPAVAERLARLRVAAGGLGERLAAGAAQAQTALAQARAAHAAARARREAHERSGGGGAAYGSSHAGGSAIYHDDDDAVTPTAAMADASASEEYPQLEPLPEGLPSLTLLTPTGSAGSSGGGGRTRARVLLTPPAPLLTMPSPHSRCDAPGARLAAFRAAMAPPRVDLGTLRALTLAAGVPEEESPGLRITVWQARKNTKTHENAKCFSDMTPLSPHPQLLLGVLPRDVASWPSARAAQRASYARLVRELVVVPSRDAAKHTGADASLDHPLSLEPATSAWARHFAHAETREQIGRDVERTQREMHFFSAPGAHAHRAAMARALFVYAATNASVRYVQGMNELMAPIYYLAATAPGAGADVADGDMMGTNDGNEDDAGDAVGGAEACAFAVFVPLLGELRDLFCAACDRSDGGVAGTLGALSAHLACADAELSAHLEGTCAINPQFYAFRWITTALTQEFPLPDALRLWDALLADEAGPRDALTRAAAAMVLHLRPQLLAGDFASNLKLLQAFPPTDGASRGRDAPAMRAGMCEFGLTRLILRSFCVFVFSCAVCDILRVANALPRGLTAAPPLADDAGIGGIGGAPAGVGAAGGGGLRASAPLKPPASWAARRGVNAEEWVNIVMP
jgi:hypothetical protein